MDKVLSCDGALTQQWGKWYIKNHNNNDGISTAEQGLYDSAKEENGSNMRQPTLDA
jgi:hypothetical protein